VGLPGLVACRLGAHVTLTDYDPGALQLLQHNIKENIQSRSCGTEPSVCKLDFTDSSSTTSCGQHDIILAADVAYVSRTAEPLTDCMSTLCQDPHGLVLMGHQVRKSVSARECANQCQLVL
jgi:predicted nicotinamide N-methyase